MRGWPLAVLLLAIFAATAQSYAAPSITSTSGSVFYVDSSSNVQPNLLGNYVSFNVTNTSGSTIADAWVTIGSFTGSSVSLAPNEPGSRTWGRWPRERLGPSSSICRQIARPSMRVNAT
jgi:hypothetical protein